MKLFCNFAALPHPNPYTLSSLFNSLPANSPLRHLALEQSSLNGLGLVPKENGSPVQLTKRPRSPSPFPNKNANKKLKTEDFQAFPNFPAKVKVEQEQFGLSSPFSPELSPSSGFTKTKNDLREKLKTKASSNSKSLLLHPSGGHNMVVPKVEEDSEEIDVKVKNLLSQVNANLTRQQLLEACHLLSTTNGDSVRDLNEGDLNGQDSDGEGSGNGLNLRMNNNNNNIDIDNEMEEKRKLSQNFHKINLNLKKKNGIEGLAARLQQELCQNQQQMQKERSFNNMEEHNNSEEGENDNDHSFEGPSSSQSENEGGDNTSKLLFKN